MAEDTEEAQEETIEEDQEPEKKRFKIAKPNPLVFIFLGPAIIIFVVYIVLSNFLISSELRENINFTLRSEYISNYKIRGREETIGLYKIWL